MNFLLLNQFFPPDLAPTGCLLADVASALAAEGHSVTVVCGGSDYSGAAPVSSTEMPGLAVHRVRTFTFGHGRSARLVSYASFYVGALRRVLFSSRPDVILTLSTPPLLSLTGTLLKHLRGVEHLLWEMDLYPDAAVALSIFRAGSLQDRVVGVLADFSRRHSDGIIALGPCMRDRLIARGIPNSKVFVRENWADGSLISPRPFPPPLPLTVLYSGNLGFAHDADTIADAMTRLNDPACFHFVFAGAGPRRPPLEARCSAQGIRSATFMPYQDRGRLAEHFGNCHVGLVTQNPATCGAVVPSKTYAIMAAGRPFIFVGPPEATPALILDRFDCGWRIQPGDAPSLVSLLETLASQPKMLRRAGEKAREAFLEFYDRPAGVSRILESLKARREDLVPVAASPPSAALPETGSRNVLR